MEAMHQAELSILLHRALEARVGQVMEALAVSDWPAQPEPLHQVRVASRRVRAVLDLVDPDLYPGFRRQTRRFRRLTRALGPTREVDVHAILLEELADRPVPVAARAALEHALEDLARQRCEAALAMAAGLRRVPLKKLPRILEVPNLPDPFAGTGAAEGIWGLLQPWLAGAFDAIPNVLEQEDVTALHALRIRIKRLRYALEILAGGFHVAPDGQLRRLKALQSALGEHHDLATLEAFLRDLLRGLGERQRSVLAAGSLDLLSLVAEDRLCAYERFRALAVALVAEPFAAGLRAGLGLEPTAADENR